VILASFGLLGSLLLPVLPRKESQRGFMAALAPIPQLAKSWAMGMAGITSFAASTSMVIGVILLVPYMKELGNSEAVVGTVRTVGSAGSVVIGISFGRIVVRFGQQRMYFVVMTSMGLALGVVPFVGEDLLAMTLVMFAYGTLHGVLGPLYPLTASTYSSQEQRGMAMAYVGLYWAAAQVIIPLSFGAIALAIGLRESFWVAGGLFLTGGLLIPVVWPLLTHVREPAEQATG